MVLGTQSSSNEDSQGRQLRVSKKLSKAISSVPRSRFQKPRPNLPGSKRTESTVSTSSQKINDLPQNNATKSENSCSIELPQKEDKSPKNSTTPSKEDILESSVTPQTQDVLENSALPTENIPENSSVVNSEEIRSNSDSIITTDSLNNGKVFENADEDSVNSDADDEIQDNELLNSKIVITEAMFETGSSEHSISNSAHQNISEELSKNLLAKSTSLHSDNTQNSVATNTGDASLHSDTTQNSTTTNTEYISDLPVEDVPSLNSANNSESAPITAVNSTDKSFKYPHLASILSKKRFEPRKEVQHKRRKKFKKGDVAPERSKMTMADLIYWNPTKSDPPMRNDTSENEIPASSNNDQPEESLDADNPVEENKMQDSVPKLVIAEDGSINIDQSSLVISRNVAEPTTTEVIKKDDTTYSSFRKRPMTKHWTPKDTTIFYKALSLVGTDFGLMEQIFPHRTRRELKLKFKREEKFNIDLINRAMYESHLTFDANTLGDLIKNLNELTGDFSTEDGQDDIPASAKDKKKPAPRKRKKTTISIDADIIDTTSDNASNEVDPAECDKMTTKRKRKAKKLPEDFLNTDEIEDMEEMFVEINSNDAVSESLSPKSTAEENSSQENEAELQPNTSQPNSQLEETCETTNIEILCIEDVDGVTFDPNLTEGETIFVPDNTQVITVQDCQNEGISQTLTLSGDSEQQQCITVEYVEDVNQTTDLSLLNKVMAFEVVSSNSVVPKRRRKVNFTPNVLKKPVQPVKVSSTNYTPV